MPQEFPAHWWDAEGEPIGLPGASADSLEWLRLLQKKFYNQISPDGQPKLDACVRFLEFELKLAHERRNRHHR